LQRNTQPLSPALTHDAGSGQVCGCHVNVGRENANEEDYETPSGGLASGWDEESNAAEDLRGSADVNDGKVCGQVGWNDLEIRLRGDEVKAPGEDKENCQYDASYHVGGSLFRGGHSSRHPLTKINGQQDGPAARRIKPYLSLLRYERVAVALDEVVGGEDMGLLLGDQLANR